MAKIKKFESSFCRSVLLSFCENRLCLSQFSPCARGLIRAKSDPCSAVNFLAGTVCADFFLSCQTPVFSGRISLQPKTKLPSFLLKYFAVVLNYLPNEWILRGGSARVLASSCSQHSRRVAPSSRRSKRGDLLCHIALLRKNRHLSLVPTLSGYALKVSWSWSELALKSATKFFACVAHCVCLPAKRKSVSISHFATPSLLEADTMLETQNRKAWCQWREGNVQETITAKEFVWLTYLIYRWLIRRSERQCGES